MFRSKCTQTTFKIFEILKDFEKADGFHLLFGSFLCEVIKEEFSWEELLIPGMSLKPVFLFANRLSVIIYVAIYIKPHNL